MPSLDITMASSVLAILRRDVTASCVADRYGVTEAQIHEWLDVFVIAGVLALAEIQRGGKVYAHLGQESSPQKRSDEFYGDQVFATTSMSPERR